VKAPGAGAKQAAHPEKPAVEHKAAKPAAAKKPEKKKKK